MKFLKKKEGKAIAVIAILALLVTIITHVSGNNPISNVVRSVFTPFQTGFSYLANQAEDAISFIYEMKGYKEENERLVAQNTELKKKARDVEVYHSEIEELRSVLELKNSLEDYNTTAASVIGYSTNNYYDKIQINRGRRHGIEEFDTVIAPSGLVGTVTEVGLNHSIVSTILADKNTIGIKISRTGDIGVVEGDEELCINAQCKLTFIDKGVNIIEGDVLETSGSGDMYPAGLNLGIIRDIKMDSLGMLNYATVDTAVDFGKLHEVVVIKR